MTPKERVQTFFKKKPVDTMPLFSGMGTVTIQAIEKMGIPFAKVHTDAELMARSAITSAEMFDMDGVVVPYDMCTIPEALGRGVSLYENAEGILYPTVPSKWANLDEVDLPGDFSGLFDQGRMPVVDGALKAIQNHDGGKLAVGGWVLGPFTMAGQVIELDVLLKGVAKDKQRVTEFLDRMTDLVITVAKHYEELGVDFVNIREMGSGTDLLSPRMWKTLIKPNLEKVFSALSCPSINHICGSTDLIVEMMGQCGADAISVDQKNNLAESRQKLGDGVLILGNFDPYATLVQMDAGDVPGVIEKCISDGADAVWPGCDIWPDVKKENMEAYVKAVRDQGGKPSPAVGRI
ncbi:MAG: uroporphyrinogen decarboxylase family protein [Desulfarculaceae bacterium]|jgi:[methyl-Co(III) methanol-specific corrinoid protein]:coenzyme M methyltransferase